METLAAYFRDQAYHMWYHFLHLHCGFPQPDPDFVRSDQERMSSNEANRNLLQMVHEASKDPVPVVSRQDVDMQLDLTDQERPSNIDQGMQDTQVLEGVTPEEELDEGMWDDLYEDEAVEQVNDGRKTLVPFGRMGAAAGIERVVLVCQRTSVSYLSLSLLLINQLALIVIGNQQSKGIIRSLLILSINAACLNNFIVSINHVIRRELCRASSAQRSPRTT